MEGGVFGLLTSEWWYGLIVRLNCRTMDAYSLNERNVSDQSQLEKMISDLSMGLSVMKHEQEYMEVRERLHRMSKDHK